jgi:hypothetical protein
MAWKFINKSTINAPTIQMNFTKPLYSSCTTVVFSETYRPSRNFRMSLFFTVVDCWIRAAEMKEHFHLRCHSWSFKNVFQCNTVCNFIISKNHNEKGAEFLLTEGTSSCLYTVVSTLFYKFIANMILSPLIVKKNQQHSSCYLLISEHVHVSECGTCHHSGLCMIHRHCNLGGQCLYWKQSAFVLISLLLMKCTGIRTLCLWSRQNNSHYPTKQLPIMRMSTKNQPQIQFHWWGQNWCHHRKLYTLLFVSCSRWWCINR